MRFRKDRWRDDLAMVTEEVLRQRIQGIKNEKGVYITPAFPKLIYVLEEDNIHRGKQVLVSDQIGGRVYGEAHGSGLYFREDHASE